MTTEAFRVTVECYAGYRGEETPRRFTLVERTVAVADVLDRWLAPDHRYFKVRGEDGCTYVLRHDIDTGAWEVTAFSAAQGCASRPTWSASRCPPSAARPAGPTD